MSSTTSITISRRSVKLAAGCTLAIGSIGFSLAGALPAQALQESDNVWVCKYVGQPGNERLKEGKNPIEVNWKAISKDPDQIKQGAFFPDAQGRSYIVQVAGNDPGVAACEAVIAPTDPPTTTTEPQVTTTTTEPEVTTTTTEPQVTTTTTEPQVTTTTT
ncbi:MAG: hypothetical protein ACTHJJ_01960, partial [Intrasporangium sp.]|uniref:hypothetical protein n=1 Tax=Intrasporangium sp. TaxID=1925024 RepID=UPI003F803A88